MEPVLHTVEHHHVEEVHHQIGESQVEYHHEVNPDKHEIIHKDYDRPHPHMAHPGFHASPGVPRSLTSMPKYEQSPQVHHAFTGPQQTESFKSKADQQEHSITTPEKVS